MYSDYSDSPPERRFPKVPLDRRAYAFLLDFVSVWLLSSFASGFLQIIIFLGCWFGLRVVLVEVNQGQSLGTWAFDTKVIDLRLRRIPGIVELSKREGILGGASLLAMIGLNINFMNAISMLLLVAPLAFDCGLAIGDEALHQAFHDRVAGTAMMRAKRGFSLDLRLKRLWYEIKRQLDQRRQR
ncbi:MAG: RDD family protein [Snowella sp.]|nr:RDD family protein [Snowella sp.]